MTRPEKRRRWCVLLIVVVLVLGAVPVHRPPVARAGGLLLPVQLVHAFGRSIAARNRVYREANSLEKEKNELYDAYRETIRSQLIAGDIATSGRSQAQVYLRLVPIIENERSAVMAYLESEKRRARAEFHRRATAQVLTALAHSSIGKRLIGRMRTSLDRMRESAANAKAALESGDPFDVIVDRLQQRLGDAPELRRLAAMVGGAAGERLDSALGGLLTRLSTLSAGGATAIDEVINEIDRASAGLDAASSASYVPRPAAESPNTATIRAPAIDDGRALETAARATTNGLVAYAVRNGTLQTETIDEPTMMTMRDRVRNRLLASKGSVSCVRTSGKAFRASIAALGAGKAYVPQSIDPNRFYLVCSDVETGAIILSRPLDETPATTGPEDEATAQAIPAGRYEGAFDETLLIDLLSMDFGEPDVNEIEITIDDTGLVSGTFAVHQTGVFIGCSGQEDDWTATVDAGQRIGAQLPQTLITTWTFRGTESFDALADECLDPPLPYNETDTFEIEFTTYSDGTITGSVDEGYGYLLFELHAVEP